MNNQRLPLRSGEVTWIEFMFGLVSELERGKTNARRRIEFSGQTRLYKEICTKLDHLMHNILMTVPEEKLYTLKANLCAQHMKIIIGDPPLNDGYTRIRSDTLQNLCAFAAKESCSVCMGDSQDMAKCPFRPILREILMVDISENGRCMGTRIDFTNKTCRLDEEETEE